MIRKAIILFVILSSFCVNILLAQSLIYEFINSNWEIKEPELKKSLITKQLSIKELFNIRKISYYDWLEPVSLKITYVFENDGEIIGKIMANAKKDTAEKNILYNILKPTIIKLLGKNNSSQSLMGAEILAWEIPNKFSLTLSVFNDIVVFTVFKKNKNIIF